MSTPRSLDIPEGVDVTTIETDRGSFAAHTVRGGHAGHVLLIPGWTGSKEDFTPLLPLLADAGFEATAYDQRGQYETAGTDDADYSLSGLASDALAVAQSAAPTSQLLGHSFGGLVAQQAAVDHPEAWDSLSLLCTGPGGLGESPQRPLSRLITALGDGTPMPEIVDELKGKSLVKVGPEIADFVHEKFERTSRVSLAAMTQHLIDSDDLTGQIATTGLPCWVGRGEDDDAWPHDVQDRLAKSLDTSVVVVPDSAHSPAIENPAGLATAWLPFLRRSGGAAG